ncbi:MAG TPA: alpha/beta hydrolase [Polyangiales bacterium]|jgi:acetyl esterase|nr:alpha/beta hydrolase [Polyangiales bacterium]
MPQNRLPLARRIELAIGRKLFRLPHRIQLALSRRAALARDGASLHPEMQLLLTVTRQLDALTTLSHPTVAIARQNMLAHTTRFNGAGPEVASVRDLQIVTTEATLPARQYMPRSHGAAPPLLVYFPGGGFALGNLDTHDHLCRVLCHSAHVQVLSVEYRKAPECPYPAATNDALAAFRYARAQAAVLGADPARVAVGGDSAGANLATYVARSSRSDRPPYAQILIYPVTNRDMHTQSRRLFDRGFFLTLADIELFDRWYAGERANDDPDVSPLLDADLQGLCPALLVTAEFDPLRDEGEAYARALTAAGNSVDVWREPGLMHGYVHSALVSPAAEQALERLASRTSRLLNR